MTWMEEIINDKNLHTEFLSFYNKYGISGVKEALKLYADTQQKYICRTKSSISKLRIGDIYYLEIQSHNISVHTQNNIFHKYGTLNKELKILAPYGFLKCNQSCIVSLYKIQSIFQDHIILVNGSRIHMSRNYAQNIIVQFYSHIFSQN